MTMLIKLENGNPVGNAVVEENFRSLYPDLTLPAVLTPEITEPLGFGIFEFTQLPPPDPFKNIVEGTPVRRDDYRFHQTWLLVDKSPEELAAVTEQEKKAARAERNLRLARSDWTQMPDSPVDKELWKTYRQALRDLPQQEGFPWGMAWPQPPV